MPDGIHVTGLPTHQVTSLFVVKKVQILQQQATEKLIAHIVENALRTALEDHLMGETQGAPHQCHRKQDQDQSRQLVQCPAPDHVVHDTPGDIRIYNGQNGDRGGHHKPYAQQYTVFFQKSPEPFYGCHMISSLETD